MAQEKILVTSALPYVNNVPHLGNMVCVVSADVYTRFLRSTGRDVVSVLGTDEHGTTTEVMAMQEGITPKELTDKYFKIHKQIYDWFLCSFDCFGRTSSAANKEVTLQIFDKLYKNGYIREEEIEQAYCLKDEKFLADRFVEGKCPHCNYEHARGDQCENCGRLLDAVELIDAKCKFCGMPPEIKRSKHLFIDLPKLKPDLLKWIKKTEKNWSQNAITLTMAWIEQGLKPRCITRDLKWGIPVPVKGYENKVFYSWFDAPIGYIGITKEKREDWKELWMNPKQVRLVQFMGKDNIPFHTILFPSFLIGTKEKWTLMDSISSNEYLNYEGGQFSKSRGLGVFGDDAMKTGIPADVWRYYLMVNRPEKTDTEFKWEDFQLKINSELAANVGNFVNRTITFLNNFFDKKIPEGKPSKEDKQFFEELKQIKKQIEDDLEKIELKEALRKIMIYSKHCNNYFQKAEPWKTIKEDKEKAGTSLFVLANCAKDISILVEPYMPGVAENIRKQLKIEKKKWEDLGEMSVKAGHTIGEPEILFKKLEDDVLQKLKKEFEGKLKMETAEKKDEFSKIDLRVAKIEKAEAHPDADKLVILQIDVGEFGKRQIVAGIRAHYKVEELEGRKIVLVSNLKPAKLRGKESKGMLLAADDGKSVRLLSVKESVPGTKVFAEGSAGEPEKEISYDEFAKFEITTKGSHVFYNGKKLKTDTEDVTIEGVADGAKVK